MRRSLALAIVVVSMAANACGRRSLAPPAPKFAIDLTQALLGATAAVPVPKGTMIVALIYEFPVGTWDASLDVRPIRDGTLPAWVRRHPLSGSEALKKPGSYVAIVQRTNGSAKLQLRYVARISDPRYVRAEWSNPPGAALVKLSGGATSVRVPLWPDATAIGFEVDGNQHVSHVQYVLDFGAPPTQRGIGYRVRR